MTYVPFRQRLASSESTTLAIKLADRLTGPAFFDVAKQRRAIATTWLCHVEKSGTDPPIRELNR